MNLRGNIFCCVKFWQSFLGNVLVPLCFEIGTGNLHLGDLFIMDVPHENAPRFSQVLSV